MFSVPLLSHSIRCVPKSMTLEKAVLFSIMNSSIVDMFIGLYRIGWKEIPIFPVGNMLML